jgi:hypothetical protein
MNFLEALRAGRPIRRIAWLKHPPVADGKAEAMRMVLDAFWAYPRPVVVHPRESAWIALSTGDPITLRRDDYLASDWETMP